ncbi:MAG: corrinoid protein, partial [Clostridia bacterium]|nr:corrinoid protein [Clostridia bacterium]
YADYVGSQIIKKDVKSTDGSSGEKDIFYCIEKGLEQARELTADLLKEKNPIEVIDEYLIPALNRVGDNYEKGKIFLPQLIASADCAKLCFDEVKKHIPSGQESDKGKIVLATVKGDVHDIGKNIVKTVLENYGFKVIDLGKNVPPMSVVEAVKKDNIKLCGLSALMTTTVENMKETIALLKEHCPECKVMVGGAVLTDEYAKQIGADKYCKDANVSAKYASSVLK